jgi:GTP-binding protein EngB required for normal cell division
MKFKEGDKVMVKTKRIHANGEIKNGMIGDVIQIIPFSSNIDTYTNNCILVRIPIEFENGEIKMILSWFYEDELELFVVPNKNDKLYYKKEDKMEERNFEVLVDKKVIASDMTLSDALIFMEAYINKYYAMSRLIMSIRKMEETVMEETVNEMV